MTAPTCGTRRTFQAMEKAQRLLMRCCALGLRIRGRCWVPLQGTRSTTSAGLHLGQENKAVRPRCDRGRPGLYDVHEAFDVVLARRLGGSTTPTTWHKAYDESGEMLMHMQARWSYDKFAGRS